MAGTWIYLSLPTIVKDPRREKKEEGLERNLQATRTMPLWVKREVDLDSMAKGKF